MPVKLNTTIKNIDIKIKNQTNKQILRDFYDYLQSMDTSENYQNGLLKVLIRYAEYMGEDANFYEIQEKSKYWNTWIQKGKRTKKIQIKKWNWLLGFGL